MMCEVAGADHGLPVTGVFGPEEATVVLDQYSEDGYVDDGVPAGKLGYMYKVWLRCSGC